MTKQEMKTRTKRYGLRGCKLPRCLPCQIHTDFVNKLKIVEEESDES